MVRAALTAGKPPGSAGRWNMRARTSSALLAVCASLLASCSGSGSDSAPTITVSGTLVDARRAPIPFVAVVVGGRAPVFTDVDGRFTVSGVTAPYDATVVFGGAWILSYVGLTRTDPTLYWVNFSSGGAGLCRGSIRGEVAPYGAATQIFVVLDSTAATDVSQRPTWPGGTSDHWEYTLNPYWQGSGTLAGSLDALGWTVDSTTGLPNAWVGATADVTVTDGVYSAQAPALSLAALPTDTVSGTITSVATIDPQAASTTLDVRYPGGTTFRAAWSPAQGPDFSYVVPTFAGATFDVTASAPDANGSFSYGRAVALEPGAAGQTIHLAVPPALLTPVAGATGFTASTQLTWTPFADAVHVVTVWAEHNAPSYQIVTAGSATTLPDLRPYGVSLNPAGVYKWIVDGYAPFASVDDVAGGARIERWSQRGSTQLRTFTTAP